MKFCDVLFVHHYVGLCHRSVVMYSLVHKQRFFLDKTEQ